VVNFFGRVEAADNSSIENSLVAFFSNVRVGEGVSIGKDLVSMFGALHTADSVSVGNNRVVQPPWLFFGPVGFIVLIVFLVIREYRDYQRRLIARGYRHHDPR
jgi:acetyltransferase-like isoleucine patch superfamily enzyme